MTKMRTPTVRDTARALALAFALAVALAGLGCGGKPAATTPQDNAEAGEPVSEQDKSWGGWRWKGKRDNCFFVHANRCFDDEAKACKAAKCKPGSCKVEGGGPATIRCKG